MRTKQQTDAARALYESADLWECLLLIKNGVPLDVAFSLPVDERLAWAVVMGEINGGKFDWDAMQWRNDE